MGNAVLHSKHQNRAKPTPPSLSILGLVEGSQGGGGVLSHPLHVHPVMRPPSCLGTCRAAMEKRGVVSTSCLTPLNCTLVLGFSQVLRSPSPPTLVNYLRSQLRQWRPASSSPCSVLTEQAGRGPACGPPLAGGERDHPAVVLPARIQELRASLVHSWSESPDASRGGRAARSRVQKTRPSRPRTPNPPNVQGSAVGAQEPCSSDPSPRAASRSWIPGKSPPFAFNSLGGKRASAHPAHTGIRKRNPHPAQAKAHHAPVTHRTRSLSIALCPQHGSP